jgi:hypothetical protein
MTMVFTHVNATTSQGIIGGKQRFSFNYIARALVLAFFIVLTSAQAEAACKSTTFIPKTYAMTVRNVTNGETLSFMQSVYQGRPTVITWYNGRPNGAYYVPVTFAYGNIKIILVTVSRYETWRGQVRLVRKIVPKLTACGAWRF